MSSISPLSRTIAYLLTASIVVLPVSPGIVRGADAKTPAAPATPAPKNEAAPAKPAATVAKTPAPTIVPANLFAVPEGLEVTVWATTPLLHNPTNIDIDKDGRVWVAEGVDYRSKSNRQPGGDKIVVLEDTTGAGKADKSTVFVQDPDLVAPLGIAVIDDKVIVSQPPNLLVFTDDKGDHVFDTSVDKREVLLSGFNGRNHDHSLHSVTAGPDGLFYFNQGNTGAQFTDKSGKTFRIGSPYSHGKETAQVADSTKIAGEKSDDGHVWIGGFTARMNPDGSNVEIIGNNYRNSYEQAVNSLGDIYQSDNDDPPACRVTPLLLYGNAGFASADGKRAWGADKRPGQDIPTAEWRQEDPGTMPSGDVYGGGAPTGVAFYENGALGKKWPGLLLACEAGRNVVFGYFPKPQGAGFKLDRFDFLTSNKEKKFAGSDFLGGTSSVTSELPTLFRPADVCVGPDGAIYVADWFDARVGGHATLDNTMSGTIYRIAPKGFKPKIPKFDLNTTAGQITALKSPAVNVRYSGFERLKAQGEKAVPAVAALLKDENPYIAARAIWLLAQMGPAGVAKVKPLLDSKNDTTRLVAYRALKRANVDVLAMDAKMVNDKSAAVRREVALSLRDVPAEQSRDLLVKIAQKFDGKDRTYLEAFGTGASGKETEVYDAISKVLGGPAEKWSDAFAWLAWRLHVPAEVADLKTRALDDKLSEAQRKLAMDALAFVQSPDAPQAMIDIAGADNFPLKENVLWWLNSRRGNNWRQYGLTKLMRQHGLLKEKPLVATPTPEVPADAPKPPTNEEVLALTGDPQRGQAAMTVCLTCHKVGKQGADFGPELTQFGKTQPREVIVDSILHPSKEISHGYEGTRIETKDGLIIDGIVLTTGDPTIVKCVGGQRQEIDEEKIKSVTKMDKSLMFPPEVLGLTAQTVADIAAYLKSGQVK
ncbi:membrane-bound dehydrogenase domain protein [Chthoniobacter flavus Ellin428]|uniref:Membrane-bound dehydrogenase domain protein n=1 Tax=Chthoniobacter flavus Ellin428 TaxID=497964 RepID=B4DB11_9BACT|nr:PVC-type heme-binding CxxCH protein [Chthoniobacter flavus]EDY16385.1 membrane-bound dehydrogenase domain protein [Chthoniobacter flavus Ellin428]TCO92474.1 putative membrane-bound dehydrogenase-like protein [Chthoniobacter flavus]